MQQFLFLTAAKALNDIPGWFVICMGMGTVFVGLICIIILCKITSVLCRGKKNKATKETVKSQTERPAVNSAVVIENREEIIAAVAAVCAEDMGTDVSAIKIHSFKKI